MTEFCARVVYSAFGRLALASLWDSDDERENNENGISVIHFKKRLGKLLKSYLTLFPDIKECLCGTSESQNAAEKDPIPEDWKAEDPFPDEKLDPLMTEIYSIYLKTGYFYHCDYRLVPAVERSESCGELLLVRGGKITRKLGMSGLGTWEELESSESPTKRQENPSKVMAMFQIPKENHAEVFRELEQNANWKEMTLNDQYVEYLNLTPKQYSKYWQPAPVQDGRISLLRTNGNSKKRYWLYRFRDGKRESRELPDWKTEGLEYRRIAAAILNEYGELPPIRYKKEGDLVFVTLNYLLPSAEQNFFKLWSWPQWKKNWEFNRSMSLGIFEIFQQILKSRGYRFEEEK